MKLIQVALLMVTILILGYIEEFYLAKNNVSLALAYYNTTTPETITNVDSTSLPFPKENLFDTRLTEPERHFIFDFLTKANDELTNSFRYLDASYFKSYTGPLKQSLMSFINDAISSNDNKYVVYQHYPYESYLENIKIVTSNTLLVEACTYWSTSSYSKKSDELQESSNGAFLARQAITVEQIGNELFITNISRDDTICSDMPETITNPITTPYNYSTPTNMPLPTAPTNAPFPTVTLTDTPSLDAGPEPLPDRVCAPSCGGNFKTVRFYSSQQEQAYLTWCARIPGASCDKSRKAYQEAQRAVIECRPTVNNFCSQSKMICDINNMGTGPHTDCDTPYQSCVQKAQQEAEASFASCQQ